MNKWIQYNQYFPYPLRPHFCLVKLEPSWSLRPCSQLLYQILFELPQSQWLESSLIFLTFMILWKPNSERNSKKLNRSHFTHYQCTSLFECKIVTTVCVVRTRGRHQAASLENRPAGSPALTRQNFPDLAITIMTAFAPNQCKKSLKGTWPDSLHNIPGSRPATERLPGESSVSPHSFHGEPALALGKWPTALSHLCTCTWDVGCLAPKTDPAVPPWVLSGNSK